jgi:hypothetical protein
VVLRTISGANVAIILAGVFALLHRRAVDRGMQAAGWVLRHGRIIGSPVAKSLRFMSR